MGDQAIIRFSRHVKRRAKLYGISESTVRQLLEEANLVVGEHVIIRPVSGLRYPLKIVVSFDGEVITIITTYPLKKGEKDEGSL
jgi:hypothetical protein